MQSDVSVKRRNKTSTLNVCCECGGLLFGSTSKAAIGRQKARLIILGISTPRTHKRRDRSPTLEKMSRPLLLPACALHKFRLPFGDVSSGFLQTSASDEHWDLTIKVPPEVGYLFPDSAGKPARYVRLMKSFHGLAAALRAWWLDITQNLSDWLETHVY